MHPQGKFTLLKFPNFESNLYLCTQLADRAVWHIHLLQQSRFVVSPAESGVVTESSNVGSWRLLHLVASPRGKALVCKTIIASSILAATSNAVKLCSLTEVVLSRTRFDSANTTGVADGLTMWKDT